MAPRHSLCDAAKRGDLEAVRKCIRAGESVNSAGDDGFTPLAASCDHGHPLITKLLLDSRAQVDAISLGRNVTHGVFTVTALQLGCVNGHPACVRHLIDAQANVNLTTTAARDITPLHACLTSDGSYRRPTSECVALLASFES